MKKSVISVVLFLCMFLGVSALPVQAASLTSSQVQSILRLLSSFGASQTVINNVNAALTQQATVQTTNQSGYANSVTASQPVTSTVTPSKINFNLYAVALDGVSISQNISGQLAQAAQFISANSRFNVGYSVTPSTISHMYAKYDCNYNGTFETQGCVSLAAAQLDPNFVSSLPLADGYMFFYKLNGFHPLDGGDTYGTPYGILKGGVQRPQSSMAVDASWWLSADPNYTGESIILHELDNQIDNILQNPPYNCAPLAYPTDGTTGPAAEKERLAKITPDCYARYISLSVSTVSVHVASTTITALPTPVTSPTPVTGTGSANPVNQAGGSEQASIDGSVFTQSPSLTPTFSGTASGLSQVSVVLSNSGGRVFGSGLVMVVNGHWTTGVYPAISPGQYTVTVYDPSNNQLANGAITVTAPKTVANPTITITSPSAGSTYSNTALIPYSWQANFTVKYPYIYIMSSTNPAGSSLTRGISGTSNVMSGSGVIDTTSTNAKVPIPSGQYLVEVCDQGDLNPWTGFPLCGLGAYINIVAPSPSQSTSTIASTSSLSANSYSGVSGVINFIANIFK